MSAITRVTARSRIRGCSESTNGTVVQFGVETMPLCCRRSSGLTSGTTSGTPSCWRKADESSKATAPFLAATGQSSFDAAVEAEMNATSAPSKASCVVSWTICVLPRNVSSRPSERFVASSRSSLTGKLRSSMHLRNSAPTTPVAPTRATVSSRPTVVLLVLRGVCVGRVSPCANRAGGRARSRGGRARAPRGRRAGFQG